jgi:hypothetical protein
MPHPDEGLIHAWLDGELDPAEAARVEALVASDAEWAAAAAEARGLIAASARIVGSLDRVPANVIPKAPAARPTGRPWVWRAVAVLAVMAGSAVVLKHETPVLVAPKKDIGALAVTPVAPMPTPAPSAVQQQPLQLPPKQALQQPSVAQDAKVVAAKKSDRLKEELADAKAAEPTLAQPARDKDAAASLGELRGKVSGAGAGVASANAAGAERRAVNAPMAATAQSLPSAPPAAPSLATEKFTRLQPSCFEQREPPDSASRVIRLNAAALADSIRLETLVLRGDTLAAVNGRLRAVRVPCPAP